VNVLDTSALLAWLQDEPGADQVSTALLNGATIHTVSWAEVLSHLADHGLNASQVTQQLTARGVLDQLLTVDPGQPQDAIAVADLGREGQRLGLSLGDRYCLALAQRLAAPVLTTTPTWASLTLPITVELAT